MKFNTRNIIAYFISLGLIMVGAVRRSVKKGLNGEFVLSVYFHDPSSRLFESCLKWLQRAGFQFISLDDLSLIIREGKPIPKGAVFLTVDDGWKNNRLNIAQIAEKYKVPVAIFVSTEPVEKGGAYWWSYIKKATAANAIRQNVEDLKKLENEERVRIVEAIKIQFPIEREALTIEEVKEIASGKMVTIGSHTVTHPILTTCSDERVAFEINTSKQVLESWLSKPVQYFAYPNGNFTDREISLLKKADYKLAFTTQTHYLTTKNINEYYSIPRFEVFENASFAENICRMSGVWFNKRSSITKN